MEETNNNEDHSSLPSELRNILCLIAKRLRLAEKVAAAKFLTGKDIDDPHREKEILNTFTHARELNGLDPTWTKTFFQDQMNANKYLQKEFISGWRVSGSGPMGLPINLDLQVRPVINEIDRRLMEGMSLIEIPTKLSVQQASDAISNFELNDKELTALGIAISHFNANF